MMHVVVAWNAARPEVDARADRRAVIREATIVITITTGALVITSMNRSRSDAIGLTFTDAPWRDEVQVRYGYLT